MNLGNIKIITRQDQIMQFDNHRTVALVESFNDLNKVRNLDPIQIGSILLPSYDATCAALDGDINRFRAIYYGQLSSRECDEFMSLILFAAYRMQSIKIYIPADEMRDLPYAGVLREYFQIIYGYTINVDSPGMYNPAYDAVLASKFLLYKLISPDEFFAIYPVGVDLTPEVVSLLIFALQPFYGFPLDKEYLIDKVNAAHGILKSIYSKG